MQRVIKQETIGATESIYVCLEVFTRWNQDGTAAEVYKVSTNHKCGDYYRTDKEQTYTDPKKARATYSRYLREAKNG